MPGEELTDSDTIIWAELTKEENPEFAI